MKEIGVEQLVKRFVNNQTNKEDCSKMKASNDL